MTIIPKQLGADRKKLAYLGVLLVVLVAVFLWNREPSAPEAHTVSPLNVSPVAPAAGRQAAVPASPAVPPRAPGRSGVRAVEDFKPSLKPKEGVDISQTDPSLKLELLAKLKGIPLEIGPRGSVFDWGKAPPPPQQDVAKLHPGPMPSAVPKPTIGSGPGGADPSKPPIPPVAPIPLKFYGYSAKSGAKRAFFLDGDDIDVAGENEVIKKRYKIVKIGVNSVVVEDLTTNHQQTLPLVEELAG